MAAANGCIGDDAALLSALLSALLAPACWQLSTLAPSSMITAGNLLTTVAMIVVGICFAFEQFAPMADAAPFSSSRMLA